MYWHHNGKADPGTSADSHNARIHSWTSPVCWRQYTNCIASVSSNYCFQAVVICSNTLLIDAWAMRILIHLLWHIAVFSANLGSFQSHLSLILNMHTLRLLSVYLRRSIIASLSPYHPCVHFLITKMQFAQDEENLTPTIMSDDTLAHVTTSNVCSLQ